MTYAKTHLLTFKTRVDTSGFGHVTPSRLLFAVNGDLKVSNNRTDARKTDVNLSFTITNCQISRSRTLRQHCINYKIMRVSCLLTMKSSRSARRISAVNVKSDRDSILRTRKDLYPTGAFAN